ncbi:MAG TPA: DNA-binding response regulator [Cyanobacteria bacterium UBA11369]|nr:DNA-binding response regulator [Cyanobacteria bacterium UBA11371]HBE36624.1 DNA-binding response regulator [Cyanobacteria bacterium UBA11368]HBE48343.1 DNA-binding response regulator [Cyanobacteria bacterium UBA11369]
MSLLIVFVDDDPGIRLSVSDYLEMSGYMVMTAKNGQEALALVEAYQPHLLVTDIVMPKMDGYELVRRVRQRPEFRLLPVIFLTARTNTEERIRAYGLGCDLYLAKPFEIKELGAMIRNLLERSRVIHDSLLREQVQALPAEEDENTAIATTTCKFTKREQQVLQLLTHGHSNVEIGAHLHLSHRTVEKYVTSLLRKTATNNRVELVRYAIENRLVE